MTVEAPPQPEQETPEQEAPNTVETSEAAQARPSLWEFSAYVDLPNDCEAEKTRRGSCKDPQHFHAWCRIPNKFQHKDIREYAMAAKARRQRQLHDPESNSGVVLESTLEMLRESNKEDLVEEIVGRDAWRDQLEAIKDIAEIEVEEEQQEKDALEPAMKYAHIEKDEERLREIEAMDEGTRPEDEYEELARHITGYYEAIEHRIDEIQKPQRDKLLAREVDDLVDIIKADRIDGEAQEEYLHVYNSWMWVVGTLKSDKSGRQFGDLERLKEAPEEVVDAVQATFTILEAQSSQGKP